jgi:hypothetical protein|tara:strand:- start:5218 stop:6651 length:1434 start_codon:yes stop_codon:yes gene_type:complete
MDFVSQEREKILLNDNTAQERLVNILETMNIKNTTLEINESLSGDLDFSILSTNGFRSIQTIIIPQGSITSINNLPDGLNNFVCKDNLLLNIETFPSSLTTIIINNNYLTYIDVSNIKNLKELDVNNNKIDILENLPPSLVELKCEYNKLQSLNLTNLPNLKILHISNNNIIVIENLPDDLIDFRTENTPNIEYRNTNVESISINDNNESISMLNEYYDKLNKYFQLKNNYEIKRRNKLKQIYKDNKNKRRRNMLISSYKSPCIKCKRPVNTIFTKDTNKYIAICGDINSPCELNIKIYNGEYAPSDLILSENYEQIQIIKNIIIEQKLDTLFSYVDEEESKILYNKQMKAYNTESEIYTTILNKITKSLNDNEKNEELSKLKNEVFDLKERMVLLQNDYKQNNNKQLLTDMTNMYITDVLPKFKRIQMLNYEIYEKYLHFYPKDELETRSIFKYPYLLNKLEYNLAEEPNVLSFNL